MPDEAPAVPPEVVAAANEAIDAVFLERSIRGLKKPPEKFTVDDAKAITALVLRKHWPVSPVPSLPITEATPAERIYSAYPRKVARKDAMKAIANALAAVPFEKLFAATTAYAEAVAKWTPDERAKFVPHPATWFNRESYLDDPKEWERKSGQTQLAPVDYSKI